MTLMEGQLVVRPDRPRRAQVGHVRAKTGLVVRPDRPGRVQVGHVRAKTVLLIADGPGRVQVGRRLVTRVPPCRTI